MWSTPIDQYCERTDPSFWSEPLNALTNVAFLIAAAAAYGLWRRTARDDLPVALLILIAAAIGIGSFLFHTLATRGASLLDVIPIAVFIYGYLLLALKRYLGVSTVPAVIIVAAFAVVSQGVGAMVPRAVLNGSANYLPALAALVVVGWIARDGSIRHALFMAAAVFALSLAFRSIDSAVCAAFPLGTHFVWHSLNGLLIYLLLRVAITASPRNAKENPPAGRAGGSVFPS